MWDDEFIDLAFWSDVILLEFQAGEGICVPTPQDNGKNWVYWDCMLIQTAGKIEPELCCWLNSIRLYNNYSMIDDTKYAAASVRTRNFN